MIPADLTPRILQGHVIDVLRTLPERSVQCAVTSPPYWGLRAYGTEPQVWGGRPEHAHEWAVTPPRRSRSADDVKNPNSIQNGNEGTLYEAQGGQSCSCGAWRGELGLEPTPQLYVAHLVEVFREVRRVLRGDGTLWLNLGDTYSGGNNGYNPGAPSNQNGASLQSRGQGSGGAERNPTWATTTKFRDSGLPIKNLVGIPWRVAFALQDDGWWLRSDILWSKPNPMPESVTDRPTRSHEYIFLLTKSARYFYDQDAFRAPFAESTADRVQNHFPTQEAGDTVDSKHGDGTRKAYPLLGSAARALGGYSPSTLREVAEGYDGSATKDYAGAGVQDPSALKARIIDGIRKKTAGRTDATGRLLAPEPGEEGWANPAGPNLKTVWQIATQPYAEAHFATFPEEIPRRAILLGTSAKGACAKCGAPWERETVVERGESVPSKNDYLRAVTPSVGAPERRELVATSTIGWSPTCSCNSAAVVPCVVLDPFSGSGTVAQVARSLSRRAIGIDLNESYVSLARSRSGADTPSLERFAVRGEKP